MNTTTIFELRSEHDVVLPTALEEAFIAFVSGSGMPFEPTVTHEDERSVIHFLFLNVTLEGLVTEFLATFVADDVIATEIAVMNERLKHTMKISKESGWLPFVRQHGTDRTRICFIRTSRSVPLAELEERIELVS